MSPQLFARSPDLQRLRDEGYDVGVHSAGFLLVRGVPYVTPTREVARGMLMCPLTTSGDVAAAPGDHTMFFQGQAPCDRHGQRLPISATDGEQALAQDLSAQFYLSIKFADGTPYPDYHVKVAQYVATLQSHAKVLDPEVDARTFPPIPDDSEDGPFEYLDSASSRAGITAYTERLAGQQVAVVGLGGTGSYVLDLLAKSPVKAIHLYDADQMLSHNAFRAPGAASLDELRQRPTKVDYLAGRYGAIKRGIVAHAYHLEASNAAELAVMDFIFLCMEGGPTKRVLVESLEASGRPFVDVGIGVTPMGTGLGGAVRVTTSTPTKRDHFAAHVSFEDLAEENLYAANIQIAELNALNAALAVIRWKKHFGFYYDPDPENTSTYSIEGNFLVNAEHAGSA